VIRNPALAGLATLLVCASAALAATDEHAHHQGGLAWSLDPWSISAHGFANLVRDHQGGTRGDDMTFANSMLMVTARRPLDGATLELRGMFSLDPAMGPRGYPLLFQTGETADGRFHLIDRQHPHDFFMELGARYSRPWAGGNWFVYAALPGEPALGPPAFMHRASGMRIPEAPLAHHWLDSTHISMGVVTFGVEQGAWKIEASRFNGREPDQHRWDIETRKLDSTSARITWSPAPGWSVQASYGDIRTPDDPHLVGPTLREKRTTVSVAHAGHLFARPWASTLAWGQNDRLSEHKHNRLPAWLFESTLEPRDGHAVFIRAERITHDEATIPLTFGKVSAGYIVDVARAGPLRVSVGALVSYLDPAPVTRFFYGDRPRAHMLFVQARF
jgi:hypothetical protein